MKFTKTILVLISIVIAFGNIEGLKFLQSLGLLKAKMMRAPQQAMRNSLWTSAPKTVSTLTKLRTHIPRFTHIPFNQYKKSMLTTSFLLATGLTSAQVIRNADKEKEAEEKKRLLDEYNKNIVTIFAHGIKSSSNAGRHRHTDSGRVGAFIEGPLATFDFKDTQNGRSASFGQEDDVKKLEETCNEYQQRTVLAGSSRGAATCLNYLGSRNPTHVAAAVVESPFSTIETLVSDRYKSLFKWLFPNYNSNGLQPISSVKTISKDIPILIFCSKDDEIIPVSQTIECYKKLKESGHTKSHILIVDHGAHANILINKDGQKVRNAIHAFYQKYNLPYNEAWANAGQSLLEECQPSNKVLDEISAKSFPSSWKAIRRMSGS